MDLKMCIVCLSKPFLCSLVNSVLNQDNDITGNLMFINYTI